VLYVHLYEVRPSAEYITKHGYPAPHSKGDRLRVIITCDQSQAPLYLLQSYVHPFAWECYNGTPLPTFDVHRKIEQVHFSFNLDQPRAFQWSISLSLDSVPTFDSLEMKLKNFRLPVQWVDLPGEGWKAAIGLAYGEVSCQDLLSCRDFCLMASHGDVMKFKKMIGGQEYAVKQVVKSEYKDAPFPAIAPDNLRIATASHYEYRTEKAHLVTSYAGGGHLFYYLQKERRFDLERSRLYIAELLHTLDISIEHGYKRYDLRPLAIKLDRVGRVMICDYDLYRHSNDSLKDYTADWYENRYPCPEMFAGAEPTAASGIAFLLRVRMKYEQV
jgi:serum/glucocorticoid-regulated kinase 2